MLGLGLQIYRRVQASAAAVVKIIWNTYDVPWQDADDVWIT